MNSSSALLQRLAFAARYRNKRRIGLYGGSFNPIHGGHIHIAKHAIKALNLDHLLMLVSPGNPHKDHHSDMASFESRFAAVKAATSAYPAISASNIEHHTNTRRTADTVQLLKNTIPTTQFYWIMGADNLWNFHTWYNYEQIAHTLPIAIFNRPGYEVRGYGSQFAQKFASYRQKTIKNTQTTPAWSVYHMPLHPASATHIRLAQSQKSNTI